MKARTRREFLQTAVWSALLASSNGLAGNVYGSVQGANQIRGWLSDSQSKFKECPQLLFIDAPEPEIDSLKDDASVLVNLKKPKQEILGFGAAFTDAACYNFKAMEPASRAELFNRLYSKNELNLNVARICIGSSDYATKEYSYDDGEEDPELKRFSIEHDTKYVLPVLKEARKVNPDLFLLASPWSPPGWMKPNKSMLGGNMQRKSLEVYARYFLKFLRAYEKEGVNIQAVSVQNEVDTDQDGRMPACAWPQEYEIDFVRGELGPLLEKEKLKTKIWIIDHNYSLWGRALCELEAENMKRYVGGVAWHGYAGSPELMTRVHDAFPDVDMFWTEGGPDYTDPEYGKNWTKWASTFAGILNNWCRAIIAWNYALDESGKPNIGPFPCGGLVTINSKSKEISYSGQYYAIAHYSKFIKRGARALESECKTKDLAAFACENPDGSKVLVASNSGAARQVTLHVGNKACQLSLPADSVGTFVWS